MKLLWLLRIMEELHFLKKVLQPKLTNRINFSPFIHPYTLVRWGVCVCDWNQLPEGWSWFVLERGLREEENTGREIKESRPESDKSE